MRNVVGEMKQRMHPKIERFTTGCKALGESKKRQLVGMLAGKEYVSGITVIELVLILVRHGEKKEIMQAIGREA